MCYGFLTDSSCPTHSHQLLYSWQSATSTHWDISHFSAPPGCYFHIFCNLPIFIFFHDFSPDSVCPNHSYQLLLSWPGATFTPWDISHISAPPGCYFSYFFVSWPLIMFIMISQLILFVLFTPTNCCFHRQAEGSI